MLALLELNEGLEKQMEVPTTKQNSSSRKPTGPDRVGCVYSDPNKAS